MRPVATSGDGVPEVVCESLGRPGTGWAESFMGGSPEAERALFDAVLPRIERIQETVASKQQAAIRRAFHNKGDVVALRFAVSSAIPDELRVGFLRPGASYSGFGRFSRSQSFRRSDGALDQRGFAFRLETDEGPQDVLLSNTPASFARDPVQFLTVTTIFAENSMLVAPLRVIGALGLGEGLRVLADLLRAPDRRVTFTSQRYWSRTAFQFGDAAARLFVRPLSERRTVANPDAPDALSDELVADLRAGPRSFELCAQLFVDERRTPIEIASQAWPESVAPPVVIGTVEVLQQDLESGPARELAARVEQAVGFSPFVTPGLRPLGRMNRVRDAAYLRSARRRGAGTQPSTGD